MYGGSQKNVQPMTLGEAAQWVQRLLAHPCAWIIETSKLIGHARLDNIDEHDRRASLAIGIDDSSSLGKGLGSEAIGLVLEYAFDSRKLHRVSLRVLDYNTRAIRAYQKCGFVIEGRERQAAFVDGEWVDDLIMGILEPDFRRRTAVP